MRVADLMRSGPVGDVLAEAVGHTARPDPVLPRTGGPAGNARLTAWTGAVLLVLGVAELLTLLDVRGLISWHVAIGALLVPPALVKTSSTGWRILRYYLGNPPYQDAGPPPLVMRLLGPLVVLSTLAVLASGVVLVLLGEQDSRQALVTAVGLRVDWITVHQAAFATWAVATGLHVLGRIYPMLRLTFLADGSPRVPGGVARTLLIATAVLVAAGLAVVLVRADGGWGHDDDGPRPGALHAPAL